jgi:hypothetical protein
MNFLQLVNWTISKTGGPSELQTVLDQRGEARDYVSRVQEAWQLIQLAKPNWKFMEREFSFDTQVGVSAYAPGDVGVQSFARWRTEDSVRMYLKSIGRRDEQHLCQWSFEDWRDTHDFGERRTERPSVYAIDRSQRLIVGPTPDDIYTITGRYQHEPLLLAGDEDVPQMPARFHWLIVYRAMRIHALYESAPEVLAEANDSYDSLFADLETDQLPDIDMGEPLA